MEWEMDWPLTSTTAWADFSCQSEQLIKEIILSRGFNLMMLLVKNDPCGLVMLAHFYFLIFQFSFYSPWYFFVSYYFKGSFMLYQSLQSEPFWLYYWLFFALHIRRSIENEWIEIVNTYPISRGEISISDFFHRVVGVGEKDQKRIWKWNLVHNILAWLSKTFSLFFSIRLTPSTEEILIEGA